jgi:hypothetical protein
MTACSSARTISLKESAVIVSLMLGAMAKGVVPVLAAAIKGAMVLANLSNCTWIVVSELIPVARMLVTLIGDILVVIYWW